MRRVYKIEAFADSKKERGGPRTGTATLLGTKLYFIFVMSAFVLSVCTHTHTQQQQQEQQKTRLDTFWLPPSHFILFSLPVRSLEMKKSL